MKNYFKKQYFCKILKFLIFKIPLFNKYSILILITAAREGLVIEVVQNNNKECPTKDCAGFGNYITILHSDGTITQYFHLKQNGAKVNIGDPVKKSSIIGLSGNTGWSNGPHLHFTCYLPSSTREKQRKTIKTIFRTGDGNKTEYLIEKKRILKNIKRPKPQKFCGLFCCSNAYAKTL